MAKRGGALFACRQWMQACAAQEEHTQHARYTKHNKPHTALSPQQRLQHVVPHYALVLISQGLVGTWCVLFSECAEISRRWRNGRGAAGGWGWECCNMLPQWLLTFVARGAQGWHLHWLHAAYKALSCMTSHNRGHQHNCSTSLL